MTPPPGTRDREATKDRIVQAAFDEFTKRGFAGARVDQIAESAGCNKALLYQYFGDKEALFEHILVCKMAEIRRMDLDPARADETAGRVFDFHAEHPWLSRLMMWEALDFGTGRVPNEDDRAQHWATHVENIAQAQRNGTIDPTLDPAEALFSLVALIQFWFVAPQTARLIGGEDPYTPEALERRRAHVIEMARRMLEVR